MARVFVIVVVGGGASGTLTAVHLLDRAAASGVRLRVVLLDRLGRHGLGQAYSTSDTNHLLNTPAARMSALAADPDHLVRWARPLGYTAADFLPRPVYGRYLTDVLAAAERQAGPLAQVSHLSAEAVAISRSQGGRALRLHLASGELLEADVAVLATGNPPPLAMFEGPAGPRYIPDPWAPGALEAITPGSQVAIMGTGLTMADVATTVTSASPGATVHAISRHGLLPRAHYPQPPPSPAGPLPAFTSPPPGTGLAALIRQARDFIAHYPGPWQDAVDALRPHVPGLWQQLTPAQQRVFLRRVARYWEIHRHRMPPATAHRIQSLQAAGRLRLVPGRVTAARTQGDQISVTITEQGHTAQLTTGWLVNATGPGTDITATPDPLLRSLLASGLIRPDPHRLGIDADTTGAVLDALGTPSPDIYTIGPTLRGLRYETTAIPEICAQAATLATHLIPPAHPVSATHPQPRPARASEPTALAR
jgi:uncharacterized NAD(P)/FAD-binding protein YdhS